MSKINIERIRTCRKVLKNYYSDVDADDDEADTQSVVVVSIELK